MRLVFQLLHIPTSHHEWAAESARPNDRSNHKDCCLKKVIVQERAVTSRVNKSDRQCAEPHKQAYPLAPTPEGPKLYCLNAIKTNCEHFGSHESVLANKTKHHPFTYCMHPLHIGYKNKTTPSWHTVHLKQRNPKIFPCPFSFIDIRWSKCLL